MEVPSSPGSRRITRSDMTRRELMEVAALTGAALVGGLLMPGSVPPAAAQAAAGSKKVCGLGQCGACTVLMDGNRVKACLSLAALVEGREITTIEGLAQGDQLHPLQAAFIERDAFQCGYCTPGQIMAGVACINEGHAGSPPEIRDWMSGNICRCGAYDHIVAAIQDAARVSQPARGG